MIKKDFDVKLMSEIAKSYPAVKKLKPMQSEKKLNIELLPSTLS